MNWRMVSVGKLRDDRTTWILAHQKLEQADRTLINELKPIISDLLTFTDTIIPDARETVRKYADAKFEYLSYCHGIEHVLLEHA